MQFLFVSAVTRPGIDSATGAAQQITGVMSMGPVWIDDANLKATATFIAIEDANVGPLHQGKQVSVSFTGATTMAQLQGLFKAAVQALIPSIPLA